MSRNILCSFFMLLAVACNVSVIRAGEVVEFSADAIQKGPQAPAVEAKMYVGNKRVRKEYAANGQQLVEIFDASKQRAILLMPERHTYMERKGSAPGFIDQAEQSTNPCQGQADASCKKLADETIHGRAAEKWEMVMKRDGRDMRALYWIDTERNMMLKQLLPDGTSTELRLLGNEKINGRQTEKWEMVASNPQGQTMRSTQWYDPQLKIAIREEMPGGYLRELKNISVGTQSGELFRIPAGYTLVTQPPDSEMTQPPVKPAQ